MVSQKDFAIELMTTLDIYKPYINKFKSAEQTITLFEGFGGFYIGEDNEPKLYAKLQEWQKATGNLVYAVTHEIMEFGECYSFLIVPNFQEMDEDEANYEIEMMRDDVKDGYVFAYVWNVTDDWCSEYGTIVVKSFGGGIRRVG